MHMKLSGTWGLVLLGAAAAVVCVVSPFIGISFLTPSAIQADATQRAVFYTLRVPRVLTAFIAGGGLALAGMVFQAVFRNPLATPFTLGIASGASCGAAAVILFGLTALTPHFPAASAGAFAGALLALALIFGFSALKRDTSNLTMLLAGIALSFIFSSLLMFLQFFSDSRHSFQIVRWLMGGINVFGYAHLGLMVPIVLGVSVLVALHLPHLDQLMTGEDIAQSRGVEVKRTKNILLIGTSLAVSAIVAVCGPVGFVGMMVPHVCRLVFGSAHRTLGPASFLLGGAYLVACDTAARVVIAPAEMPVGVITALMGGPFFLWLLFGRAHKAGGIF